MTAHTPLTNEQFEQVRAQLESPDTSADELRVIARRLLDESGYWYMDADYWRESYRLVKGLSNDEIGAIIAVREASRCHPRPCRFPLNACVCTD